jgi:hypothetical protein
MEITHNKMMARKIKEGKKETYTAIKGNKGFFESNNPISFSPCGISFRMIIIRALIEPAVTSKDGWLFTDSCTVSLKLNANTRPLTPV